MNTLGAISAAAAAADAASAFFASFEDVRDSIMKDSWLITFEVSKEFQVFKFLPAY